MSDQEQDKPPHSFHREGGAVIFDKPPSEVETARQRREDELHEFARQQVKTNGRLARFTAALVLATFCTIVVGIWQASISQKSANAARDAVDVASRTLTQTQTANAQQRLDNAAAAVDAKTLADKNAAQASKSLQATIDNFHRDQRAWIGFGEGKITFTSPSDPRIFVHAENRAVTLGKSPAVDVVTKTGIMIKPTSYSISLTDIEQGLQNSKIMKNGTDSPGGYITMFAEIGNKSAGDQIGAFKKQVEDGVNEGTFIVYYFGTTTYRDVFKASHWTHFCSKSAKNNVNDLLPCGIYNDSDADYEKN